MTTDPAPEPTPDPLDAILATQIEASPGINAAAKRYDADAIRLAREQRGAVTRRRGVRRGKRGWPA